MTRVTPAALRRGFKAIQDLDLLKILQSEINHELSSNPFQDHQTGSLGDFVLDWDSPKTQDMVLRRKWETGEEMAISALLGPLTGSDSTFPRDALMQICIKKPSLSSILQFDCKVCCKGHSGSAFCIHNIYYLQSPTCLSPSIYRGPLYSTLDNELRYQLQEYLVAKGIGESFTNFLLCHLHKKEQSQYVNWLQELKSTVARDT